MSRFPQLVNRLLAAQEEPTAEPVWQEVARLGHPDEVRLFWSGLVAAAGLGFTLDARQSPAHPLTSPAGLFGFVDEYCLSCHDEDNKKGGLALDTIASSEVVKHPDVWEKVIRKLRARQMPPVGKDRPDEPAYDTVVRYLETTLDRAAAAHPNLGRTATILVEVRG